MALLIIDNARVVLPDGLAEQHSVVCDGDRITWVGPTGQRKSAIGETVIDARGGFLAPGFIDLHIHGSGKWLVDDGPESLDALSRLLPRYGVTSFVPGVCPRPKGEDARFLAELVKVQPQGAGILAFLLEGPYLTETGALPPEALGGGGLERVRELIAAGEPHLILFAIAPDFPKIAELLPTMTANGGPAYITHTRAGAAETQAAIELGARHATHFYDVFYPPADTDPGVRPAGSVEAILADPRVSVDFIFDGEHVDPVAVQMAMVCKGPDRVCLITDANRGAGLAPGRYLFGDYEVEYAYPGGPARFTAEHPRFPRRLAGSGLTMDQAVRNAVRLLGIEPHTAVRLATANPARVLGLQDRKGRIAAGFDADLVLLNQELRPLMTWVGGLCRFAAGD